MVLEPYKRASQAATYIAVELNNFIIFSFPCFKEATGCWVYFVQSMLKFLRNKAVHGTRRGQIFGSSA